MKDGHLSRERKKAILQEWEQDEIALLRAEGENMSPKQPEKSPAKILEEIKRAEKELEEKIEQVDSF